ncbi:hypothetical protein PsYK624_167510 [Phanerochaete sordida]|uniref:Uncharacterized protein n=1 Tax=Phanerochaete sordida TaxID=48140 RepID=A0A9P3GS22_9APHY|nr:hypothetical protein PsYK624_167510 [Phanerochaete sordida]
MKAPFMKRWWNKELELARRQLRRLGKQSYNWRHNRDHPSHADYRRQRNKYGELISRTKREHWEAFLEDVDEDNVWNFSRYVAGGSSDGSTDRVTQLQMTQEDGSSRLTQNNDEKSHALHRTFFPPACEQRDWEALAEYPDAAFDVAAITESFVAEILAGLKKFKAPAKMASQTKR